MAQAQINAVKSDKLNTPTYTPRSPSYNPKFSPPQSQDAFGLEMGMYDHRPKGNMDREDFGILTTTMDGIITAMNVMSDQMNNHTSMVVNELKEQKEKNTKFMEKVDKKLLEMKKDLHKLIEDHKENTDGRTKQSQLIVQDQRQSTVMMDKKLREMTERIEKWERDQDSFRHNFTTQVKEDHQQLISTMEGILKNLQEEREKKEETTAAPEPKKKEPALSAATLAIMLLIARIRKRKNQLPHTKEDPVDTIREELPTLGTRNLPISRNLDKMDPPLQRESRTVTAITADSRGTGHRIAPLKIFQLTIKSSGQTSIA